MNTLRVFVSYLLVFLLTACVCDRDRYAPVSKEVIDAAVRDGASLVVLDEKSADAIGGYFKSTTTEVTFAAENSPQGSNVRVLNSQGQPIYQADLGAGFSTIQLYDTAPVTIRGSEFDLTLPALTDEVKAALRQLLASAEYAAFPDLSRSLALLGVTGSRYPASLGIHYLGLSAQQALGTPDDGGQDGDSKTPYLYANPYASSLVAIASDDLGFANEIYGCDTAHGPFLDNADLAQALSDVCNLGDDSMCISLEDDPNQNNCMGMCGLGCDCWKWVCGSCCGYLGCSVHDGFCRRCQNPLLHNTAECLYCASFVPVSVVGTFSCAIQSVLPF